MTDHKNIYSALCAAQQEFGAVQKGSTNPAFKTKYADLADVAGVVIPVLASHGVCVVHYLVGDSLNAMRTEFIHGTTETRVACDVPLLVDKNNMQGMKSATTYAKRIGLESLSGVAPDDDDGNAAAKAPPMVEPRQERKPAPPAVSHDAIAQACEYLGGADDLPSLQSAWGNIPRDVAIIPAVIAAKDKRKHELQLADTAESVFPSGPDVGDGGGDE